MVRKIYASLIIISLSVLPLTGTAISAQNKPVRSIVVFDETVVNLKAQEDILKGVGGTVTKPLPSINGLAVSLPDKASAKALEGRVDVNRVDDDVIVKASAKPPWAGGGGKDNDNDPVQTTDWGVDRIDADLAWPSSRGNASTVAVIDTGIDKDHPDLAANLIGGINFIKKGKNIDPDNWDDDNGHGTHVAGSIAAIDNDIGYIGVAPEAYVYGVKVLDRKGSGYLSDVIAGIDWAVNKGVDVINLSLGTDSDVTSFQEAVDSAYNAGVLVVAAAGNDGDSDPDSDVDYPAAYDSVIAVAATDANDNRASWSSDGAEVEIAAPGVNISSTWKNGDYKTISGTSMASPHVAGTAALVFSSTINPSYDTDADGIWDNEEVRSVLTSTVEDLGANGFDNYYGFGLVDAEKSVASL